MIKLRKSEKRSYRYHGALDTHQALSCGAATTRSISNERHT
jgi:hypothetical protein